MRKIILFILGAILIIAAFFAAKYIIDSNQRVRPKSPKVIKTVFAESITNQSVAITIPANGILTAKNRLELFSEVQGVFRSSARDFKAGQEYQKGQSLMRIDAAEYYATVQAAKSEFLNLITSLMPDLRLDYPEAFPAWQNYLLSIDINQSLAPLPETTSENVKYFITGRGVYSRYFTIKNLEQRLGKYQITAPFNGILTEALVTKGTLIRQGQKLGEFIDPSVFELELAVEKAFSDLLTEGKKVSLATLDSDKEYIGTITRINGKIDQATQTIKVFAEVLGSDLKEGMYLEAKLQTKNVDDAIEIQRKLLFDQSQIFVVKDSVLDIIEVVPVHFSSRTVVVKGVPDGTTILTRSVPGAYAGMLVKIYEEATNESSSKSE